MADDIIFANGFTFKKNENAPGFVVGRMSIKVGDAVDFLGQHEKNGWVNLDIKQSRMGAYYVALDQFVPRGQQQEQESTREEESAQEDSQVTDDEDDGLPF